LSDYSGWFLGRTSIPLYFSEFILLDMEDYYVLNAKYHKGEKIWRYNSDEGYDIGNIIAFKTGEYYKLSAHKFSFYYINKAEEARGNILIHYYNEILAYYNKVFGDTDIKKFDVVSLGIINGVGSPTLQYGKMTV